MTATDPLKRLSSKLANDRIWLAALATLLVVAAIGTAGALSQVGKTFPGFLVLGNRVVASVGLSIWPDTAGGEIFQREIVGMDSFPVTSAEEIRSRVQALPAGTPVEYMMGSGEDRIVRTIPTRTFGWRDFSLLHALYLLNGVCLGIAALVALHRRQSFAARTCAPALMISALWVLTALELYGPSHLFRLHALCEAMLFPAALVMALGFPSPARLLLRCPWLPNALYAAGAALAIFYQFLLNDPLGYSAMHLLALTAFGIALVALVVSEAERLRKPLSMPMRERLKVVATGAMLALSVPIAFTLAETITGGSSPQNALALTGGIFPLALAYALLRTGDTPLEIA